MKLLAEYFQIDRRYARSINLERDLDNPNSVAGYVLTDRSLYALKQILVNSPESGQTQAVTLTGVYGTGKSAFAHFLACLCAGEESVKQKALAIAKTTLTTTDFQKLHQNLPEKGCFRAIATAQREPLAHTIIRALEYGASRFWRKKSSSKAPSIAKDLTDLSSEIRGGTVVDSKKVISIIQEVITSAQTDVILIIDELGKNLEYASLHPSESDLYLLQQLAELKPNQENVKHSLDLKFYLIGLLHQSFADYGERLASLQRNEWAKIQGRFQDIPFTESPRQMT
ncbi:MAG: hypothetical protein IM539_04600 [Pseudanabaena sp. M046S1SP1A06QC]|nr:hypothetical protein [Pseudanabaena sp. M046S1SP1A06QC]